MQRLEQLNQAETGVEQLAGALQGDQRLEQHRHLRRQLDLVAVDDLRHVVERLAQLQVLQRLRRVIAQEVGNVHCQGPFVQVRRRLAHAHNDVGQQRDVAAGDGQEHLFDVLPQPLLDAADHAEVHQSDTVAGQQHEVSRVRVRVIKPLLEDHVQVELCASTRDFLQVEPFGQQPLFLLELDAVHTFHRQHARRAVLGVRLRYVNRGIVFVTGTELLQIALFPAEVQFPPQHAAHLGDRGRGAVRREFRHPLGQQRQPCQHVQVFTHRLFNAGVLHLDDHVLARHQASGMDLADGRRSDRGLLEFGEQFADRLPQFLFDQRADQVRRVGGHIGLQLFQFIRQLHTDEVRTGTQQLTEFDEGGT